MQCNRHREGRVIIADDPTGVSDAGVQFVRAGYRMAVVFYCASASQSLALDAVVYDTDSRALPPMLARERMLEKANRVRKARIAHKKLDSTLRGPVAAELEAALKATGRARAVVAPAFPDSGRKIQGGVQLALGVPSREGHIPSILDEVGLTDTSTLSTRELSDRSTVLRVFEDARWSSPTRARRRTSKPSSRQSRTRRRSCGSARQASHGPSARSISTPGGEAPPTLPAAHRNTLVVVGSINEVTREQLRLLAGEARISHVSLDSLAVAAGTGDAVADRAVAAARTALVRGLSTVLYSTSGEEAGVGLTDQGLASKDGFPGRIAEVLAEVVARLSDEGLFDALVLTGGDTAAHVARALGATGIVLRRELEASIPFGTLIGPQPYVVVTKAGGFGVPETLVNIQRALVVTESNDS